MKSILIIFDQAHYMAVLDILSRLNIRGFTAWKDIVGRGTNKGLPHYGSHAWPSVNNALLTVVPDNKVELLLKQLKALDDSTEELGLKAFVTPVEQMI